MHQSVFLFDYQRFRQDITPVLEALDRGNYGPLYEWQKRVVQSMKPEDWILHDEGTDLDSFEPEEQMNNSDLGYWLLVVLSTYLRQPPSPLKDWGLFGHALYLADNKSWLMLDGSSTTSLIKPGSEAARPESLRVSDPYWYWVIPTQAYQSGWLSLEQIRSLEQRLVSNHDAIMEVDQRKLVEGTTGLKDISTPERITRLQTAYDDALKMLRTAIEEGVGLYWIFS